MPDLGHLINSIGKDVVFSDIWQNDGMNRRYFLRNAAMTGGAVAGTSMMGSYATDRARALSDSTGEVLSAQMKALENRFDSLEQRHKNLVRAGAVAIAVSTGIDVLAFM